MQDGEPRLAGIAMVQVNEPHAAPPLQLIEMLGAALLGNPGPVPSVRRA
jgi:hypothetical protein